MHPKANLKVQSKSICDHLVAEGQSKKDGTNSEAVKEKHVSFG